MMNAIQYALAEVKRRIPPKVLDIGLSEYSNIINNSVSADERIMAAVIRPHVLTDLNLIGGIQLVIDLNKCNIGLLNNREFIVDIPKKLTANKSIINLLSIVSNTLYSSTVPHNNTTTILDTGLNMMNNLDTANVIQTARLELISDNLVLVQDPTIHLTNGSLRCTVENDENLKNLKPRSYKNFAKLCVFAVQGYLYNQCVVKMDQGYIYGGHELSVVKDIIDKYEDAYENYDNYIDEVMKVVMFMNDSERSSRFIKSLFGNTT